MTKEGSMIQKIINVGNSTAIIIPREFLNESGLKIGDEMIIEMNTKRQLLLIKPKSYLPKVSLTPEFFEWLDNFTKEYQPILKKLASRYC